jgi:hypothetical protein
MEMRHAQPYRPLASWQAEALRAIHQQHDLPGLVNSGKILHYGCGGGYAIAKVPQAMGYERDAKFMAQHAALGVKTASAIDKLQGVFDIVFCHERATSQAALQELLPDMGKFLHRNSTLLLAIGKDNPCWKDSKNAIKDTVAPILAGHGYKLVQIQEQYVPKYRQALIFYRIFGMGFYNKILTLLGWLKNDKRYVIKAIPA